MAAGGGYGLRIGAESSSSRPATRRQQPVAASLTSTRSKAARTSAWPGGAPRRRRGRHRPARRRAPDRRAAGRAHRLQPVLLEDRHAGGRPHRGLQRRQHRQGEFEVVDAARHRPDAAHHPRPGAADHRVVVGPRHRVASGLQAEHPQKCTAQRIEPPSPSRARAASSRWPARPPPRRRSRRRCAWVVGVAVAPKSSL